MPMQSNEPEQNRKRGELIAVCSAKGGVGRTVLSVNLAAALSKKNIKIGLLDGDFQFGDICLAMDMQATFTIKDIIDDIQGLDAYTLDRYLNLHEESGVKILPSPERPEFAELITPDVLDKVIPFMLQQYDYVVVDTEAGLHENTLRVMEKADQILMISNLEMATLKNSRLMLETLDTLEIRDKVQVVVNRANMESVLSSSEAASTLGEDRPIYIPDDFGVVSQSVNIGIPFVMKQGKTDVAKAVFKMAEQLSSRREIKMFSSKNGSLFDKLFMRKRWKEGTE